MNEKLKISFVPHSRSPRFLWDMAAESFALVLLSVSMPIISTLSYSRSKARSPLYNKKGKVVSPTKMRRIQLDKLRTHEWIFQLNKLKSWYWRYVALYFGDHDSNIRCAINSWLLELTYVKEKFMHCEPLHRYAMQLLFASEAGNLKGVIPATIHPEICQQFSNFLMAISPFSIRGLSDNSIKLADTRPVTLVMLNSSVKRIHLSQNLNSRTLERLRLNCRNVNIITFDLTKLEEDDHTLLECSGEFFRTFFANQLSPLVMEAIHEQKEVPKSFQYLKEVIFRCDHVFVGFSLLIQALTYAYPGVKITLSCMASVPYGRNMVKYPFVCPTYQVQATEPGKNVCQVFFCDDDIAIDTWVKQSPDNVLNAEMLCHTLRIFVSSAFFLQDVLSMLQVRDLRYIYSDKLKLHTSTNVSSKVENIGELFVFGPIPNEETDKELVAALNQCPNLDVLSFMVKPLTMPVLGGLKYLTNLKVLSVLFTSLRPRGAVVDTRYAHCQSGLLTEKEADKFTQLMIMAAPNLEVLEATCIDKLLTLIEGGCLQKLHTFCVVSGRKRNIKSCLMGLPRLRVVLFEQFIDYGIYLSLKRYFYYSKLEISYKKGRLVLPFVDGP